MADYFDFVDIVSDSQISITGIDASGSTTSYIGIRTAFDCLYENMPSVMVACESDVLVPLIIDKDAILHPIFKDFDEIPEYQMSPSIKGFSKYRLPRSHFAKNHGLQIIIYDKSLANTIAVLENIGKTYSRDGWFFLEQITMLKNTIPSFITLTSRICNAKLTDLLE